MRSLNKKVNGVGKVIVDSLMLALLFGILAVPASSVSLLHISPVRYTMNEVLSISDIREPDKNEVPESSMPGMLR